MKITIGAFDAAKHSVPATFVEANSAGEQVTHQRDVNACLDANGKYDADATARRVDQVAAGVAVKIRVGAITNPVAPETEDAAAPSPDA